MLGKVGWRFITDPDALVCRILKAKYFPRGNFLNAEYGHSPSFTWRSICSSQDLVRRGVRWRIGYGDKVNVWNDPWLRRDNGFRITTAPAQSLLHLKVSDLIKPGTRMWNVELISELFQESEAAEIVSIPLSLNPNEDKLIWHFSRNGVYSVRSAYALACRLTIDDTYGINGEWNLLWKIKVPPKVKIFLWRALQYCLPTKSNLLRRGVQVEGVCRSCSADFENEWHCFINCPFAEECWHASGFHEQIYDIAAISVSFKEFVFGIIKLNDEQVKLHAIMLMWQIWNQRNSTIWKQTTPSSNPTWIKAQIGVNEWASTHNGETPITGLRNELVVCRAWHNLSNGWVRANIDAAFFPQYNATGIGIIVRSNVGSFIAARVNCLPGCLRVEEGEVMGLHEALSWIKELGFERVEIVTDSKIVVDAISSSVIDYSEFGGIVENCKSFLEGNPMFSVKHVRRDANFIAHCLARASRNFPSPFVWNEPPTFVEGLPSYPCSCA